MEGAIVVVMIGVVVVSLFLALGVSGRLRGPGALRDTERSSDPLRSGVPSLPGASAPSRRATRALARVRSRGAGIASDQCLRCGGSIQSLGIEEFRVGGTGGGWKLIFGEWAELGEAKVGLEVLACLSCRHVELRAP